MKLKANIPIIIKVIPFEFSINIRPLYVNKDLDIVINLHAGEFLKFKT